MIRIAQELAFDTSGITSFEIVSLVFVPAGGIPRAVITVRVDQVDLVVFEMQGPRADGLMAGVLHAMTTASEVEEDDC